MMGERLPPVFLPLVLEGQLSNPADLSCCDGFSYGIIPSFLPPFGHSLQGHGGSPQRHSPGSCGQLLLSAWARAFPPAQSSPFSPLQAASSVTAALEDFVKPERLAGENSFRCSR